MIFLSTAHQRVRGAFLRAYTAITAALKIFQRRFFYAPFNRLFNSRPGLKRGALVLGLFVFIALPAHIFLGGDAVSVTAIWAFALFALFLGMGAERAAVEWSAVFALPPLNAFAFWRWHTLERKRFVAVLCALALGIAATITAQVLA